MSDPFYRTRTWLRLRHARLQLDRQICVVPGCGQRATVVDHIVSRRAGGADALRNLRSLC
jgi:5-methylcytosine-specific restriction endonuclease McrA